MSKQYISPIALGKAEDISVRVLDLISSVKVKLGVPMSKYPNLLVVDVNYAPAMYNHAQTIGVDYGTLDDLYREAAREAAATFIEPKGMSVVKELERQTSYRAIVSANITSTNPRDILRLV